MKNQKKQSWLNEKSKLKDWFHYCIEINILKYNVSDNFNLRDLEVKIQKQTKDLCMNKFETLILKQVSIKSVLQELIQKLNMFSCYIKINDSGLYDLDIYNFYNNTLEWINHIEKIISKYDLKEKKYQQEVYNE